MTLSVISANFDEKTFDAMIEDMSLHIDSIDRIWATDDIKAWEAVITQLSPGVNSVVVRKMVADHLKKLYPADGVDKGKQARLATMEVMKFTSVIFQNTNVVKLSGNAVIAEVFNHMCVSMIQGKNQKRELNKFTWGAVASAFPEFFCSKANRAPPMFTPNGGNPTPYEGLKKTRLPNFLCHHANLTMGLDTWSAVEKERYVRAVLHYTNWFIKVRVAATPPNANKKKADPEVAKNQRRGTFAIAKSVFKHHKDANKQAIWVKYKNHFNMDDLAVFDNYDPINDVETVGVHPAIGEWA
jgi:hypothetical protein